MPVDFSLFSRKLQIDIPAGFLTFPIFNTFPQQFNCHSGFIVENAMSIQVDIGITAAGTVAEFLPS